MKICTKCKKEKQLKDFPPLKNRKDNVGSWCRVCLNDKAKEHYEKNYHKNPEKYRERTIRWKLKNPNRIKEIGLKSRLKMRIEVLKHYGNGKMKCACCGENEIKFLSLDHIDGGGKLDRKKNGYGNAFYFYLKKNNYPKGFQILCHNCNMAKGFYGVCPHKDKKL